jgi:hypothetical protein
MFMVGRAAWLREQRGLQQHFLARLDLAWERDIGEVVGLEGSTARLGGSLPPSVPGIGDGAALSSTRVRQSPFQVDHQVMNA